MQNEAVYTIVKGFRPSPILDDSRYAPGYAAGQA
jgi:hypothetical protein